MDRILKLLEVADRGGSENERMQAAQRAQKLMLEHEISTLEIEGRANPQPFETTREEFEGMANHWKSILYYVIAKAVGVHLHKDHIRSGKGPSRLQRIVMVGTPDKIEFVRSLASSLVPFLESECERTLQIAISEIVYPQVAPKPRAYRTGFYHAASKRIGERLAAQRREAEEEVGSHGMALVRTADKALETHVRSEYPTLQARYSRQQHDHRGASAGRAAGNRANTRPNRGLNIGQRQLTA